MARVIVGDHVEETATEEITVPQIRQKVARLTARIQEAVARRNELQAKIVAWRAERDEWIAFKDILDP
jgi:uncharacterized coiled-coil DUF342 family protein